MESSDKIAIIGAGFRGLGAAASLKQHGIAYDQYDRNDQLGGLWYKGIYKGVHTLTPRRTTGFLDYPLPETYPDFPSGEQIIDYLNEYARRHELNQHLHLSHNLEKAEPIEGGDYWRLHFNDGVTKVYRGLVIAIGHHWSPRYPEYDGQFSGTIIHSVDYADTDIFKDKRVLVVGGGNSAADLAVRAAAIGASSHIAIRKGHWVLPKTIFGSPLGHTLKRGMPLWMLRLFIRLMVKVIVGDYRQYGLQKPDHALFTQDSTVNDRLLHDLKHGRITPHPGLRKFSGDQAEFNDGQREAFDLVCFATGFDVTIPFLDNSIIPIESDTPQLVAGMYTREYKNLYLFGLGHQLKPIPRYGVGPMISRGAKILSLSILEQRRMKHPLGMTMGKILRKPTQTFEVDPTVALWAARVARRLIPHLHHLEPLLVSSVKPPKP